MTSHQNQCHNQFLRTGPGHTVRVSHSELKKRKILSNQQKLQQYVATTALWKRTAKELVDELTKGRIQTKLDRVIDYATEYQDDYTYETAVNTYEDLQNTLVILLDAFGREDIMEDVDSRHYGVVEPSDFDNIGAKKGKGKSLDLRVQFQQKLRKMKNKNKKKNKPNTRGMKTNNHLQYKEVVQQQKEQTQQLRKALLKEQTELERQQKQQQEELRKAQETQEPMTETDIQLKKSLKLIDDQLAILNNALQQLQHVGLLTLTKR